LQHGFVFGLGIRCITQSVHCMACRRDQLSTVL